MKRIPGLRATMPPPRGRELDEEFRFHLEMRIQQLVARGWDASAARAEASRQFGDMDEALTYCRDVDQIRMQGEDRMEMAADLTRDGRLVARTLRRAPGFLTIAVLTMALGVGANVAVFGMLRGVLVDPIPVPRSAGLVALFQRTGDDLANQISYGDYVDLRARKDLFEDVALISNASVTVVDGRGADRFPGRRVSPALFRLLGVAPAIGRVFTERDGAGDDRIVIVSHDYWTTRLGSDSSVIGTSVRVVGVPHAIVGVLPRTFDFPYPSGRTAFWFPLNDEPTRTTNRQFYGYWAVARPAKTVAPQRLQSELDALARSLQREHPESNAGRMFTTKDLSETVVGDRRTAMLALLAGAAFVLLIACTNLTNLLLVRASSRRRELAIRVALGSRVRRLVRVLVLESLLLSLAGGVFGVAFAALMLKAVASLGALTSSRVDGRMMLLAGVLSVFAGLISSVWPSIVAVRSATSAALRTAARVSSGRAQRRTADVLVSAEVALSLVLLISSGLMFMTVARALGADTGFDRRSVLAFRVFPAQDRYPDLPATMALYRQLESAIASVPGSGSPVFASALPLGNRMGSALRREDRPLAPGESAPLVTYSAVWPGFFRTMGISLLAGRDFSDRDLTDSGHVTVVSQRVARELFGGENPVGRRIALGNPDGKDWHTIVGVVADVRQDSVTGIAERGAYDLYGEHWNRAMYVVVRTNAPARTLISPIRERVQAVDRELPVYEIATMDERAARSIVNRRFLLRILAVFSGIALVLCAVGIYGVTSEAVAQRRRELGIRMALGATGVSVQRGVMARALVITAAGVAAGLTGTLMVTGTLRALMYGVATTDPRAFGGAAAALAFVTMLAAWLPAYRASRVDPVEVLRTD